MYFLKLALSLIHSAIMYLAPSNALVSSFTFSLINLSDNFLISPFKGQDIIILASGSSPFLIASVALVFFFSLYGL